MRLTSGQASIVLPRVLSGLHFYNQKKTGEGEKTFFVFLE